MKYKYQLQGKHGLETTLYTKRVNAVDIHTKCIDIVTNIAAKHKDQGTRRAALRYLESVAANPTKDTVSMVKDTSSLLKMVTGEFLVLMQFALDGGTVRYVTVVPTW